MRSSPLCLVVAVVVAVVVAGCHPLDDKKVAFGHVRGVDANIAALIEAPITGAMDSFAKANAITIARPSGDGACATDTCDVQRARDVKAASVVVAQAQPGALQLELIGVDKETVIAQERVDANPATLPAALPAAVNRLLAAKFGGAPPAPSAAPGAADVAASPSASASVSAVAKVKPKLKSGQEVRRSSALMAMAGTNAVGENGTLVLTTDSLAWTPHSANNLGGQRPVRFSMSDIRDAYQSGGDLVVVVSWAQYHFGVGGTQGWVDDIKEARRASH